MRFHYPWGSGPWALRRSKMAATEESCAGASGTTGRGVEAAASDSVPEFFYPIYPAGNVSQMKDNLRFMATLKSLVRASKTSIEIANTSDSEFPDSLCWICCETTDGTSTRHLVRCGSFDDALDIISQAITDTSSPQLLRLRTQLFEVGVAAVRKNTKPCFHLPSTVATDADALKKMFHAHSFAVPDDITLASDTLLAETRKMATLGATPAASDEKKRFDEMITSRFTALMDLAIDIKLAATAVCSELRAKEAMLAEDGTAPSPV